MTKAEFVTKMSRTFHKAGFALKKHSPEILVVAGVVGTVASAVMACKATTKIGTILDEAKADAEIVHFYMDNPSEAPREYTPEDGKKDLTIVYAKTGVRLAKLYAPSVILGALSLTSIIASNNILRKRNVALAAAYATIDGSFKEYRHRVVERFGKDLDRELRHNIKAKEIEETVVNEDGKEQTVKKTVEVVYPGDISEYARFFDETCAPWTKDAEQNLYFLRCQQNYANDLLKTRGHVFLNEVYDMLGIPRTKAGQAVGWVYDEKNPVGDNNIDFGIYDVTKEQVRNFVNGYERSILLDFNVDGNIVNLMA